MVLQLNTSREGLMLCPFNFTTHADPQWRLFRREPGMNFFLFPTYASYVNSRETVAQLKAVYSWPKGNQTPISGNVLATERERGIQAYPSGVLARSRTCRQFLYRSRGTTYKTSCCAGHRTASLYSEEELPAVASLVCVRPLWFSCLPL